MEGMNKIMEEKKDMIISIRINESLKDALIKHANKERRSLSQYIYLLLESAMLDRGEIIKALYMKEGL